MEQTSASLLLRLRQPGDQAAWKRFVDLYAPFLASWARSKGLQQNDAADLVQDVLLTLLHKLPEFEYDQQRSFRAWLLTVISHKWHDAQRRRAAALRGATSAPPTTRLKIAATTKSSSAPNT